MGRESDDIDIALDDMLGEDFANLIRNYLNKNLAADSKKVSYGVIKANKALSKHLETANIKIYDVLIDLVNLRPADVDGEGMGTPEEDAFRRDLTMNSLFYNINEGKVEDCTGMGLKDIELKLVRTPLSAMETFTDDPLRLLRSIRFSKRFGFTIHPEIYECAKHPKIQVKDYFSYFFVGSTLA
jgi:tRNA nucleotidyltransferase/poly(A) polymerase